jgi:hypothetical protein
VLWTMAFSPAAVCLHVNVGVIEWPCLLGFCYRTRVWKEGGFDGFSILRVY